MLVWLPYQKLIQSGEMSRRGKNEARFPHSSHNGGIWEQGGNFRGRKELSPATLDMPVSYTHLDVYKRQMIDGLDGLRLLSPEEAKTFPEPAGKVELTLAGAPLPYDAEEMCIRDRA